MGTATFGDSLVGTNTVNVLSGGPGNDAIVGAPGNDTLDGGPGNDVLVWSNGDNTDVMNGGTEADTVQVNGSVAGNDAFTIGAGAGGRVAFQRTNLVPFALDIGGVETLTVNGIGGDDTFTANSLGGAADLTSVRLNGENGNDTFTVVPDATVQYFVAGNPPTIAPGDSLTINTAGTTNINLTISSTSGDSRAGAYTFGNRAAVNFAGMETLNPAQAPPPGFPLPSRIFVTAADAGGGPDVKIFNADGTVITNFFAFDINFTGGVRVAVGDVNNDGFPDIICAAGPGGGPNVIVFSGKDRSQIYNFFAFDINFTGGCYVAAGDVNNDGRSDIITGAGIGGGPNVTVYRLVSGQPQVFQSYFAFNQGFSAGIFVGSGDVNGDNRADVIAGTGPISAGLVTLVNRPTVAVFSGLDASQLARYPAFPQDASFLGAVRVAATDRNGDGKAEVVTVHGPGGTPDVNILNGLTGDLIDRFFVYNPQFTGGIFVANTPK